MNPAFELSAASAGGRSLASRAVGAAVVGLSAVRARVIVLGRNKGSRAQVNTGPTALGA